MCRSGQPATICGMRILPVILVLLALVCGAGCASETLVRGRAVNLSNDDAGLGEAHFLAGHWSTAPTREGDRTEEHWTPASAGTMLGVSRTIRGGRTVFHEFVRIERTPEGIFYVARPSGQSETRFRLVESGAGRLVFENPEHDFPTRITYLRTAGGITARIQGTQRGQERMEQWSYRKARVEDE